MQAVGVTTPPYDQEKGKMEMTEQTQQHISRQETGCQMDKSIEYIRINDIASNNLTPVNIVSGDLRRGKLKDRSPERSDGGELVLTISKAVI